ncbi:hypothetical protein P8452_47587 [Trifolium repens]|nr:hypothetical protein P8452_47587 [Trifolium repens]
MSKHSNTTPAEFLSLSLLPLQTTAAGTPIPFLASILSPIFTTDVAHSWDYYFSSREHTLKFDSWEEPAKLEYGEEIIVVIPRVEWWELSLIVGSNIAFGFTLLLEAVLHLLFSLAYSANMWNEALNKQLGTEVMLV